MVEDISIEDLENKSQNLIETLQNGEVNVSFTKEKKDVIPFFRERDGRIYQTLIEMINEGIIVTDENGLVIYTNKKIAEMLDYKPDEIIGKYIYKLFGKRNISHFNKGYDKNRYGNPYGYELNISTNKRKKISVIINQAFLLNRNKKIDGVLITVTDISKRVRTEVRMAKEVKNLKEISILDGLTGIYNHRHFWERLYQEYRRSKRYLNNLCLLMIDIDLFKVINDSYSHRFGDFILKELAILLKRNCRESDIAFRYGGDEFAILLTDIGYSGANTFAEKTRKLIEAHKFRSGEKIVKITISIGVSSLIEDGVTSENEFVEFADKALAFTKSVGRNKLACFKDIEQENVEDQTTKTETKEFISKINMISEGVMRSSIESIITLVKGMEARTPYFEEHSINVMNYSLLIAKTMNLSKEEIEIIRNAALLHDVGKAGISENILLKDEELTKEERKQIKDHSFLGVSMLGHIHFLKKSLPSILYHHEWYDGNGYNCGLKKDEIPLGAKIISVADAFDAMNSARPYRGALSPKKIIENFVNGAGTQFFPKVVYSFLQVIKEHKLIPEHYDFEEALKKVGKKVVIE